MHRRIATLAASVLASLALVGCGLFEENADDAQPVPAGAPGSASTTLEEGRQKDQEESTGGAPGEGERSDGAGLEDVPEVVAKVQPSVVAVLAGQGEGSGVVYSSDGVIVTNNHVVEGRNEVQVAFADGERLPARVVATDPRSDLAVLRVDAKDLPAATFAEGLPQVGELAVALGNPLGFEGTVTAGVVSGLGRSIPGAVTAGEVALIDLIQTDAAISPGSSGGALVDGQGRVIGVNVAYIPPNPPNAPGAVSLGFAIPSPVVSDVVDELLADGRVTYPLLGVVPQPVTPQIADAFDLERDEGVIVQAVDPGSPAEQAGLRHGDIIVALGDQPVRSVGDLLARLRELDPGDRVQVRVLRDGQEQMIEVRLAERAGR